jgi:RNA polymerase primary sigma factor
VSLETPIGDGNSQLIDFMRDEESVAPEEAVLRNSRAQLVAMVLATLAPREELILRKRFGIGQGRKYTLEELGRELGVTRERVRQIEAKALRKLRHPSRTEKIREARG